MPPSPLRSFASSDRFLAEIASPSLRPGYVLAGDEIFLQDRCRKAVLDTLAPPDLRDFCLHDFDLAEISIFEALDRAQTPSLMAPFQVIFLRNLKTLYTRGSKKEEFAAIDAYFRSPNPQAVLLFIADHLHLPTDLRRMDLQDKERFDRIRETLGDWCGLIELAQVDEADAARWVIAHAETHSVRFDPDAARELVDALGADMMLIASEVEKLLLYVTAPRTPSSSAVVSITAQSGEWRDPRISPDPQPSAVSSTDSQPSAAISLDPQRSAVISTDSQPSAAISLDPQRSAVISTDSQPSAVISPDSQPSAVISTDPPPSDVLSTDFPPSAVISTDQREWRDPRISPQAPQTPSSPQKFERTSRLERAATRSSYDLPGARVTLGDVETMVLAAKQRSLYELTDAITAHDRPRAVVLLHGLLNASDGGEDAAIGHLYMLARTFRQMLIILEKNVRDSRAIWQALWQGFRMPPFAAEDLIRQARRYKSRRDLTRALRLIARADLDLRSSPTSKRLVLERLVLDLAADPATQPVNDQSPQFAIEL